MSEALDRARALADRGIGILIVEQNIREALPIADRVYVLAAGQTKFEGTPRELRSDHEIMDLYMGQQPVLARTTR